MKNYSFKKKSALLFAIAITASFPLLAQAQQRDKGANSLIAQRAIPDTEEFKGDRAPSIADAGILNAASDHFFDVLVNGEPLNRLNVRCVTFHELENVKVLDSATGQEIPHNINYGFEEFTVTFNEAIPVGQKIKIVIEGATVSGVTTGVIVPYRVFGQSNALGIIPLGTALVRGVSEN